jgi:hypothetical protein
LFILGILCRNFKKQYLTVRNMKKFMPISAATIVAALTASLFGLVVLSLVSPSMAQQQAEQQMTTTEATTPAPSPNGMTTISLQDLTNNQSVTESIGGFTITQQWSPIVDIDPGTTAIAHASCGEGQVVIGGGYYDSSFELTERRQQTQLQLLIPGVQIFFAGPSLSLNAYAVQAVNNHNSPSFIEVYAICLGGEGLTSAQAQAAQEGSRQ